MRCFSFMLLVVAAATSGACVQPAAAPRLDRGLVSKASDAIRSTHPIDTSAALLEAGPRARIAQLDLSSNNVGAAGLKAIIRLLQQSETLTALSLAATRLEFTDTDALQAAAKENQERKKAVRLWMGKDNRNWTPL